MAGFFFSPEGGSIEDSRPSLTTVYLSRMILDYAAPVLYAAFDEQVRLCADTLQKKTKEYTGDDTDRLGAFKAAAALQHTTPERALAGMLAKHIVSLYDMCFDNDTDYGISTWDEKITDSLNYLFLLKAIVKEGHTDQTD